MELLDGMLKIVATLSMSDDGCDALFEISGVCDLVVKMLASNEIGESTVFQLLMFTLRAHTGPWKMLAANARQTGRIVTERMNSFAAPSNERGKQVSEYVSE
jgi:hypothetical protein